MARLAEFGNFRSLAKKSSILLVIVILFFGSTLFRSSVLIVEPRKAAVMIHLTGKDLSPEMIIAPDSSYKGIQLDTYAEGWYLINPYSWDWKVVDQIEVPEGKVGIRIRKYGTPLPSGQILAQDGQKGIVENVLKPGRYRINPYAEEIQIHDVARIPAGFVGVVTAMAGKDPKAVNPFLVEPGERGVQPKTLEPGTYYLNPYAQNVLPIDTRSQKLDMNGHAGITFPSVDGFTIHMEGTIEWMIQRERIPEVFVKYWDERKASGDETPFIEAIVEKILLPNARSFSRLQGSRYLARELLGGVTRQKFQEDFQREMAKACIEQGIVIREAVIRNIVLPDQIASPIRDRELAIRQRDKFQQEKEREKTEKDLAMQKKLEERQRLLTQAEAQVSVNITGAERVRDVAMIDASRALDVARLELEAADNQAKAKLSKGKAAADVVLFQNKAAARGLAEARKAFGSPDLYVRYLLYQRLAPSMRSIWSNTDGPFFDILKSISVAGPQTAPSTAPTTASVSQEKTGDQP